MRRLARSLLCLLPLLGGVVYAQDTPSEPGAAPAPAASAGAATASGSTGAGARDASPLIGVDAADTPVRITGWLHEDASFVGNIRVRAPAAGFTVLASDLRQDGGDAIVGRQNLGLIPLGAATAEAGAPRDHQVKVGGVPSAGIYRGHLTLVPVGHPEGAATRVEVIVEARARPNLVPLPGSEKIRLQLVSCRGRLDCWLAKGLLPGAALLDARPLQLSTPASPVVLTDGGVVALGEHNGAPLTVEQISLPTWPLDLPADHIATVPLNVRRATLAPDHYLGSVYLTLADRPERVVVPLDLSVRAGPLGPLLCLLVVILLGRFVKYMQDTGNALADAMALVLAEEARIREMEGEDRDLMEPLIARVRQEVGTRTLAEVKAAVEAVAAWRGAVARLRDLERLLRSHGLPSDGEALTAVREARTLIRAVRDVTDPTWTTKVEALVAKAGAGVTWMGDGASASAGDPSQSAATTAALALEEARRAPWPAPGGRRLRDTVVALASGIPTSNTAAVLLGTRQILSILLVITLAFVGLDSLYIRSGATFGAAGFTDYLGLILWGLSADVASRTLSSLGGTQAAAGK